MFKSVLPLLAAVALMPAVPAHAVTYTEAFDGTSSQDASGTFGQWKSRWFGANSNATHFMGFLDPDDRGNNVTGLTIFDGDPYDGGIPRITFNPAFGALITNFSFDILSYNGQTLVVYDMAGVELLNVALTPVAGPPFDFAQSNYTRFSVSSTNGIRGFTLLPFGAEGNVSIDNLEVTAVPEAATWGMMVGGLAMVGGALRRRRLALKPLTL
jgi:hypothetical protein